MQINLEQEPIVEMNKSTFLSSLSCMESDPLNIKVSIPCGGYVAGQKIEVIIEGRNESDQVIDSYDVELHRVSFEFKLDANQHQNK